MAIRIFAAGNTLTPAYLCLVQKGYAVTRTIGQTGEEWVAKRASDSGQDEYIAEDPLTLLALVCIGETRGDRWQASDEEITAFLKLSGQA
ncbi:MAG: hypothetical protein QM783_10405 [Phycisphaerales bacterium]